MKRPLIILLGSLLLTVPAAVQAQFTYTTNGSAITLTQYTGPGGAIVISNFVTSIGANAFEGYSLTSVTIPSSVISIEDYAFPFDGLTSAIFQGNAPDADPTAFYEDNNLTVYYSPGTSGWSSTFDGFPAMMLHPPVSFGSLQVIITPAWAGAAGAKWQVDGGIPQPGGAAVLGLSVGSHIVSFSPASGWTTPASQTVSVRSNSTSTAVGSYILTGFVSQGIEPFYSFTGGNDGEDPTSALVQADDGWLYGTTGQGGSNGYGGVFRFNTNGAFTPLYSFTGGNDGANPAGAPLIQASDGWLYGTTEWGGSNGVGTVFRISTNGSFTSLYSFTGGNDGGIPQAGVIQASDGYLYGTTQGTNYHGTVFKFSAGGAPTTLYSFTGGDDGADPLAGLMQAGNGYLYGTTGGGTNNNGTVFQISTNGSFKSLYVFSNGVDGASPQAVLIQASDGYLYGTASGGGTNGNGTVFKITTNAVFTPLYSFTNGLDGAGPQAGLLQFTDGYLLGTTTGGGSSGNGTVYVIQTNGANLRAVCWFTGGADGANSYASLIKGADGWLYGTAANGGSSSNGAIFVLDSLLIAPRSLLVSAPAGGPVPATNLTFVNLGAAALNWSMGGTPWLNLSPSSGSLAPGASMSLTLTATAAAANLQPGFYSFFLDFTNLNEGAVQSIEVDHESLLSPLVSFPGSDGANPYSPLLQAWDGNLYGTTANGGIYGEGAVFRITPNGAITTLYSFTGGNDGRNSYAGLIQASDGWLYGTTQYGGSYGEGTVFRISTGGTLTTLYSFTGAADGGNPAAGLIQASDGGLYGTASAGNFYGTIFRITTNGGFALLYSFTGVDDGAFPEAALVQASDGWLYGTANQGGINGVGTVFRISTNGTFDPLFSFNHADGASPAGALIQASDGWLYGTTSSGGNRNGNGTVFKMSTNAVFSAIYLFTGGSDGSNPNAGLVQANDGFLYGTASGGGNSGNGTVFKITTNAVFTPLYSFTGGVDGANPDASLIQASDGSLYGTASGGGTSGNGTVFKITTNAVFTPLYSFFPTFQAGFSGALAVSGGNLYGTTQGGGTYGQGSIVQLSTNGALTTLYSFPGGIDGENPLAGLIQADNGYLYGTTEWGGTNGGYGTVFQSSTNGAFASLYSFNNATGANPEATLVQASDGWLYGTTYYGGGTNADGTVFKISTNGAFTSLHSFNGADGANPGAALIQANDGYLYGTTYGGGSNTIWGTVFKISTNGDFTSMYSFGYSDGGTPESALLQASDGWLYGTTWNGGTNGRGTVYRISTKGSLTSLYSFTGGNDGANPVAGLIQAGNGNLYGTSTEGGASGFGTVFQIALDGTFTLLYSFSGGDDGGYPTGSLMAYDGYLYGVTQIGGSSGNGAVFALALPTLPQPGILSVTLSGTSLVLNGFNGAAGGTYYVLMSTNLALPLSQWTRVATNVLSASGDFTITVANTVTRNIPQGFYILETQ
jgi:uncharacterized repeat protein (TIGR03803 family)